MKEEESGSVSDVHHDFLLFLISFHSSEQQYFQQASLLQNDKILSCFLGAKNGIEKFFLSFRAVAINLTL